ncbi:MAG TPA: non-heme iron oxygenase ferredoxin subunit [Pirellulales bacterium]|jgi:nitrite reductase (NADH) small subunit|nr:non-heme iron oxygenase ferredoxin subunit [Pirellulales bacterium]
MPNWIQVAAVSDCPPGTALELSAGERVIALFNVDGAFHALDGICPHQGGPLGEGDLAGCIVTCPWHGWQFDVRTGQNQLSASVRQPSFPVRVEGDFVLVDLDATEPNE